MSSSRTGGWRAITAAVAIAVTGFTHSYMDTAAKAEGGELFVPEPGHARLSSLGFGPVVADYYWLQALQLVGGEGGDTKRHAPVIARLVDVVTTLDPWASPAYRFGAVWLTDSEESVLTANRMLRRAISYDPLDWRNRFHLGFNYFFYLEDNARAAEALEAALPLEGVPVYVGALVARLRLNHGGLETAAGFLAELAHAARDKYARAEYLKALDEVETERRARYLDAAREEFWRRHGEDIESVADLLRGPDPVLGVLPPAHPHFDFAEWVLDEESGRIVSSFYGSRYELHVHPLDAARRERWRKRRAERAREG